MGIGTEVLDDSETVGDLIVGAGSLHMTMLQSLQQLQDKYDKMCRELRLARVMVDELDVDEERHGMIRFLKREREDFVEKCVSKGYHTILTAADSGQDE